MQVPSKVTTWFIYSDCNAPDNLELALQQGIWGAKEKRKLEGIRKGDKIVFIHCLPPATQPTPVGYPRLRLDEFVRAVKIARLVVKGEITTDLFEDSSPVWPDNTYPYRFRFRNEEMKREVDITATFTSQVIDAIRRSLILTGKAYSVIGNDEHLYTSSPGIDVAGPGSKGEADIAEVEVVPAHPIRGPRFWVEKTLVQGRQDRMAGPHALGKALWSPQKATNDQDFYRRMREVQPGDIVFHLVDNRRIAGVSIADAPADNTFVGLPGTEWADRPAYRIGLRDYVTLDPPIDRVDFLDTAAYRDLLLHILATNSGLFYNRELKLNQGAYLTQVPPELVALWNTIYKDKSGRSLPHISQLEVDGEPDLNPANTWLFQANPVYFNLKERLEKVETGDKDDWTVTRYQGEIQPGDTVLLWQGGQYAGIYAVGQIFGEPVTRTYDEDSPPLWRKSKSDPSHPEWRVQFQYTKVLRTPISKETLLQHPILHNLQVLRAPQGTNFRVSPEEWQAIQDLMEQDEQQRMDEHLGQLTSSAPPEYIEPSLDEIAQYLQRKGLRIDERMLRRYHLALKTRGFVILSGLSGIGKTWLAEEYARAVKAHYNLVSVAPNWTTNEDLLGYFSPLSEKYHDTPFSCLLREAYDTYKRAHAFGVNPRPFHVVFDEMNLARVEYYFARFLSAMEVRARSDVAEIELGPAEKILLPPNLYFIGTVNVDETTHGFADKIYDRAQLIELTASRETLFDHMGEQPYADALMRVWDSVHIVAPFAFRVLDEIEAYVRHAKDLNVTWQEAVDEQILQKVLPKLKGADPRVGEALSHLVVITELDFPLVHAKVQVMLERFRQHGFASYF